MVVYRHSCLSRVLEEPRLPGIPAKALTLLGQLSWTLPTRVPASRRPLGDLHQNHVGQRITQLSPAWMRYKEVVIVLCPKFWGNILAQIDNQTLSITLEAPRRPPPVTIFPPMVSILLTLYYRSVLTVFIVSINGIMQYVLCVCVCVVSLAQYYIYDIFSSCCLELQTIILIAVFHCVTIFIYPLYCW